MALLLFTYDKYIINKVYSSYYVQCAVENLSLQVIKWWK